MAPTVLSAKEAKLELMQLQTERALRLARKDFFAYLRLMQPSHYVDVDNPELHWFHHRIANACQRVYEGKTKRLMVFIPPQHGKSQIASRHFPAWVLGADPTKKVVCASYSSDLANSFSRDSQRFIQDDTYKLIFPGTIIGNGTIRNQDYFETSMGGSFKTVGVGGSLTGRPADYALIDDPVKDSLEAHSETYRNRVWDWYTNVLETRLHNNSGVILIMTRWHDDDLAGRLLKAEPEKWVVLSIPAIKEDDSDPDDPREIGESLWEARHSLEKLNRMAQLSPRTFAALYQQRPTIDGGNIIKSDWFSKVSHYDFIAMLDRGPITFWLDTAYTDQKKNDPTGIMATCKLGNTLYIISAKKVLLKFPDLIRFIPKWVKEHGYDNRSMIRIEPKANGISVIDQIKDQTGLNITRTPSPKESKEARLNAASPTVESGRVCLVEGPWNDEFITEVTGFPSKPHDEYVDLLCYAIDHHLGRRVSASQLAEYFN